MMRTPDAEPVPDQPGKDPQACIWPGCSRSKAAGKAAGSGRRPDYCEQSDEPGGTVHNPRNRWAAKRSGRLPEEEPVGWRATDPRRPVSATRLHARDLLDGARSSTADAVTSITRATESLRGVLEQFTALTDVDSVEAEIAAVTSDADQRIAAARADAVAADQRRLAAERARDDAQRERDEANAAAEQLAADTAAAEQVRDDAITESDAARAEAAAAVATARREVAAARQEVDAAHTELAAANERATRVEAEARSHVAEVEAATAKRLAAAEQRAAAEVAAARDTAEREVAAARERARLAETEATRAEARATAATEDVAHLRGEHRAELARMERAHHDEIEALRDAVTEARKRASRAETDADALRAALGRLDRAATTPAATGA